MFGWIVALIMLAETLWPVAALIGLFVVLRRIELWDARKRFVGKAYWQWKKTGEVDDSIFTIGWVRELWAIREKIDRRNARIIGLLRLSWAWLRKLLKKKVGPYTTDVSPNWHEVYRRGNVSVERLSK